LSGRLSKVGPVKVGPVKIGPVKVGPVKAGAIVAVAAFLLVSGLVMLMRLDGAGDTGAADRCAVDPVAAGEHLTTVGGFAAGRSLG
jgi:hypothetical protein